MTETPATFGDRVAWDRDVLILARDVPVPPAPCLFCAARDHVGEWTPAFKHGGEEIHVRLPRCGPCADRMTTASMGLWIGGGFAFLALPIGGLFAASGFGAFLGILGALAVNMLIRSLWLNRVTPYCVGYNEWTVSVRVPFPALTREALALMGGASSAELRRADAARITLEGRRLRIPIDAQMPVERCIVCAGREHVHLWNRRFVAMRRWAWAAVPAATLALSAWFGWGFALAGLIAFPFFHRSRWVALPYCPVCRDRAGKLRLGAGAAIFGSLFVLPIGLPVAAALWLDETWVWPAVGGGLGASIVVAVAVESLWVKPGDVTCRRMTLQFTELRVPNPGAAEKNSEPENRGTR